MNTQTKSLPTRPGCYIDASAQSADYLNSRIASFAQSYGYNGDVPIWPDWLSEENQDACNDYSEALNECADECVDWLNMSDSLPYCCWTVEENSLFLSVNVDNAKDSAGFVSRGPRSWDETCFCEYDEHGNIDPGSKDPEHPAADFRGEWLHVNDHGNTTLYVRGENGQDREVWGVV